MTTENRELDNGLGSHPTEKTIIDYYEGQLGEVEHESVQCHIVYCDDCLELFRDVRAFHESTAPDETATSPEEIRREAERAWNRVAGDQSPLPTRRFVRLSNTWPQLAVAATLAVLLVLSSIWLIKTRHENRILADRNGSLERQNDDVQRNLENRVSQLEQENLALRQLAKSTDQGTNLPPQSGSALPEFNVPIYDLHSREAIRRSGESSETNRITLTPRTKSFVLILNGEGESSYSDYSIEAFDQIGRSMWRGDGLTRDNFGNFVIRLERSFLKPGIYRFRLYGKKDAGYEQVTEYVLRIESK